MKVFLTGGSGLLGSHVAERLMREGHGVRALVRASSDVAFLRSLGVELYTGDITHRDSLRAGLQGCDGLVHAAALVVSGRGWRDYERANVQGTEAVMSAAADAGVRRAVHVSSVAVYGGAEVSRRKHVDEDSPTDGPLPSGEFYGRSKRMAEAVALRFYREGKLEVAAVRPDVIYGERDRVVIPRLARFLNSPVMFLVGSGRAELPLVYAANVAQGIGRALTAGRAPGRVYNLANDFPITQREFFTLIADGLGRRPAFVPIPYSAASLFAALLELTAFVAGNRPPRVSRRHVSFMARGNPFVSARAREELSWAPEVAHAEGVRRTMEWYRKVFRQPTADPRAPTSRDDSG